MRRWLLVPVAVLLVGGAPEVRQGWLDRDPVGPPGLGIGAADCAECHAAVVEAWRGSRHAAAATNPVFTASWEHWPNGWCLGCHAPKTASQVARLGRPAVAGVVHRLPDTAPAEAWSDGVDCAVCHVREGFVVSGTAPTAAAEAVHPVRVDERLHTGEWCAVCHEFPIQLHTPRAPFGYGDTPAQHTWSEVAGSRATETCVDCHLAGHAFPGAHTPALVRGALSATVEARGDDVIARVTATGAAHRVPTGDPFRRLEVRLYDPADALVGRATLRRVFAADATSWVQVADRTVPPDGPEAPVRELVVAAPGAVRWELWYGFGDPQFEPSLPPEEVGYTVATGEVTAAPP